MERLFEKTEVVENALQQTGDAVFQVLQQTLFKMTCKIIKQFFDIISGGRIGGCAAQGIQAVFIVCSRVDGIGGLQMRERLLGVAGILQRNSQIPVRGGIVGMDLYGFSEAGNGRIDLALAFIDHAQISLCIGIGRVDPEGGAVAVHRLGKLATGMPGIAQIEMQQRVLGAQGDRFSKHPNGFIGVSGIRERIAKIAVGHDRIGVEGNRLSIACNRAIHVTQIYPGVAKIEMGIGIRRLKGQGPGHEINRTLAVTLLVGNDTQQAQHVGLVRVGCQNLGVQLFGVCQITGPVMLDRTLNALAEG